MEHRAGRWSRPPRTALSLAEKLEDIALAFADFADLKSRYMAGHSRRVAALPERMAGRLRLPSARGGDHPPGGLAA